MSYRIDKVGIVGAGTMGGGIAAHLANIGIPVVLLDIVPPNLSPAEQNDPAARNRIVASLYDRMAKARPANLARADRGELITLGNLEDDFDKLADCDWIIEVIIEQLEPKQALMARLEAIRKPGAIVSSNTSGIPIHQIAAGRAAEFRAHFLGTHFFNPPRFMQLLELIPGPETAPEVVAFLRQAAARLQAGEGADSSLRAVDLAQLTTALIGKAALEGDAFARALFAEAGAHIGAAIASLMHVFNPAVVILGGGVSFVGDLLFEPVRAAVRAHAMNDMYWRDCPIIPAALGDDAGLVGAGALAMEESRTRVVPDR